MTIGVIIQARTGSSRYPRKIYEDLHGKMTLYRVLESATSASVPHKIILAMPKYDKEEFQQLRAEGRFDGAIDDRFRTYFGHPDNLIERYYRAANKYKLDLIVRMTADCPFCGTLTDEMLIEYMKRGYNRFMGNNELVATKPYPNGVDNEIFPYWMLCEARALANDPAHFEHVSPFMYRRGTEYGLAQFNNCRPNTIIPTKFSDFSFDTEDDRRLLVEMCKCFDKTDLNMSQAERLKEAINKTYLYH